MDEAPCTPASKRPRFYESLRRPLDRIEIRDEKSHYVSAVAPPVRRRDAPPVPVRRPRRGPRADRRVARGRPRRVRAPRGLGAAFSTAPSTTARPCPGTGPRCPAGPGPSAAARTASGPPGRPRTSPTGRSRGASRSPESPRDDPRTLAGLSWIQALEEQQKYLYVTLRSRRKMSVISAMVVALISRSKFQTQIIQKK